MAWNESSRPTVALKSPIRDDPHERCPKAIRDEFGNAYRCGLERTIRFLMSRGLTRGPAEELSQEAWVRGWEHLHQLHGASSLGTWVNTIALNLFRNELRRKKFTQPLMDTQSSPRTDIAAIDVGRILSFCLPGERALLENQLNGMTVDEVARIAGVTSTAIRLRMLRARRAVRARLEQRAARLRESRVLF